MLGTHLATRRQRPSGSPPDAAEFPLEAKQLRRTLGRCLVLDGINLKIAAGQVAGLLGANGAGKTTLLKCLAGLFHPSYGDVLWFGSSPHHHPANRRFVGFAGHESFLYLELSARENLLFAARMYGVAAPQERTCQLLEQIGLARQANMAAGLLSRGMRQRLSIGRALIHDPPIVILDEPFCGLDPTGRQWLEAFLTDLRAAGRAIVFTSHDRTQCHRVADLVLEIRHGQLHPLANSAYTATAA